MSKFNLSSGRFERLGGVDLSGYYDKTQVDNLLNNKQDIFTVDVSGTGLGFTKHGNDDVLNVKRDGQTLTVNENGDLKVSAAAFSIQKANESGQRYRYQLKLLTETIGSIDIPLDMVVKSGEVVVIDGETYIKLIIANDEDNPILIAVKDMIKVYSAGNGIRINEDLSIEIDTDVIASKAYVDEAKAENKSAIEANAANIEKLETDKESLFDLLVKNNIQGSPISLSDHSTLPLQNMRFYGKSTQDGTPTTDEPIDIVSTSFKTVKVYGGNIFDISKFPTNVSPSCGVEVNGDEITFTAKTSGTYQQVGYEIRDVNLFKDKIYIGYNVVDNPKKFNQSLIFRCYDKSFNKLTDKTMVKGTNTITVPKGTVKITIVFCMNMSETAAVGDTVTISNLRISNYYIAYEPYKSPTTVTLSNSVTLRGLPVSAGGNITIDNQQFISDYLDVGSGKVVRNVGVIDSYNGEEITTDYLSTTGELSEGATVIYALQNSIEEDLQAEDVEKLQAIQPYNPNSIITSNAEMAIDYIADTKKYIDKQYSKLATAITALGGTI